MTAQTAPEQVRRAAQTPITRMQFVKGIGATLLAGVGASLVGTPAVAAAASGSITKNEPATQPDLCYEYCELIQCDGTNCPSGYHIFHCTGCYDQYLCYSHTCASFCHQTIPC